MEHAEIMALSTKPYVLSRRLRQDSKGDTRRVSSAEVRRLPEGLDEVEIGELVQVNEGLEDFDVEVVPAAARRTEP